MFKHQLDHRQSHVPRLSDVVPLSHSIGEVVAPHYRELWSVERDDVLRPIGWSDNLSRNQNYVDELTEEHKAESEQLQASNAVISQVKAIQAKHPKEYRKDQSNVEVFSVSVKRQNQQLNSVVQFMTHV